MQLDLTHFTPLIERFGPWSYLFIFLGLLLGGLLAVALLALWLGRWVLRHEAVLRQGGTIFLQRPAVRSLRLRLAPQLASEREPDRRCAMVRALTRGGPARL